MYLCIAIGGFVINPAYALVKSSLVFVLVEGWFLPALKFCVHFSSAESREHLVDMLLAMDYMHLNPKLLMDMFSQMLGTVDATVLTTRTAKREHERGEAALNVTAHMGISQLIDAVEEGENLTVVFQETDDRLVHTRELFVGLVTTGVMSATAVEHIASAITRLILRNALAVRETVDSHHQRTFAVILGEGGRSIHGMGMVDVTRGSAIAVGTIDSRLFDTGETGHLGETAQHVDQIRIGKAVELEQFAQVLDGRGDGIDEVALLFEIATEAIGTQHLQRAEEHKLTQTVDKMAHRGNLAVLFERFVVLVNQFTTQFVGIFGGCLPKEGGQVVIVGTLASALIIDEIGMAGTVEHNIARLEVAIEETVRLLGGQLLGKEVEVGFELEFMEVEVGGLQETVLEIVEIEQHTVDIKLRLGMALAEVEPTGTTNLDMGQLTDGALQQFLLLHIIPATGRTAARQGIEERLFTEVGLKIAQLVGIDSQNLGYRQTACRKMSGEIDEGVVLVAAGSHHAHHRVALGISHAVITPVAAGTGQFHNTGRLGACPLLV